MSVGLLNILNLLYIVDLGTGHSSVQVYVTAILAFHDHIHEYLVFSHQMLS